MDRHTKYEIFCNNCGQKFLVQWGGGWVGREARCCSMDCHRELELKGIRSMMGKPVDDKVSIESITGV